MLWGLSNRADREALELADRHYNRQKVGTIGKGLIVLQLPPDRMPPPAEPLLLL